MSRDSAQFEPGSGRLFGLMAEYTTSERLLEAAYAIRSHGFESLDAYSPFPVEGLSEAIGFTENRVARYTLYGGIIGGLTGYGMQWYSAVIAYPFNIGGRPLHSAISFIPITFELTILFAALTAVTSMFTLNGLPKPYHPVFNVAAFRKRGSIDRFFLCIEARDPRFEVESARKLLESTAAEAIHDVRE